MKEGVSLRKVRVCYTLLMKLLLVGLLGIVIILSSFIFLSSLPKKEKITPTPKPVEVFQETKEIQATFTIITNGTQRIFTDPKYHTLSPDVYLQADSPNTVHVKKIGVTWNDFFKTLPMKLTHTCLTTGTGQVFCTNTANRLVFYVNGKVEQYALDKSIKDGDELLVTYGE